MDKIRCPEALRRDDSLGILDMDNLKAFGDDSSMYQRSNISEKLQAERLKAFKTLEKGEKPRSSDLNSQSTKSYASTLGSTPLVPYVPYNTTNISDLVVDNTINLNTSTTPIRDSNKISFEPSEITGRSTLYKQDIPRKIKPLSLQQILATSCSEKVRNLRDSIYESETSSTYPRTADLSKNTISESITSDSNPGLSFRNCHRADESDFAAENFIPSERMTSRLASDERDWELEFAAIPLSELKKSSKDENNKKRGLESSTFVYADPNFSIGDYFNKRSESLYNIIAENNSPTKHVPVPLIDESSINSSKFSSSRYTIPESENGAIPKIVINNRTFEKSTARPYDFASIEDNSQHKSESADNSYILSLSAIADALNKIESDESGSAVLNRLLSKKGKNYTNAQKTMDLNHTASTTVTSKHKGGNDYQANSDFRRESRIKATNKENLNPENNMQLSETASFSESILDCAEIRNLEEAHKTLRNSTRQGFEALGMNANNGQHHTINNAYLKSPLKEASGLNSENKSVTNMERPKPLTKSKAKDFHQNKTTSCTNKNPSPGQKESRKRPYSTINRSLSPTTSETYETSGKRSLSPAFISNRSKSPASSPHATTLIPSPRSCDKEFNSPKFNSTSSSERRFLVDSSSPDCGKLSLPSYGLISRTNSCTTLASKPSAARCISQCSTSSEFSHRDGSMPLKATCFEVSWGSIKLRKNVKRSLQIKNTSAKRLVVRLEISGPGFQVVNPEGENLLTLQSQECRTIILSFCPTVIGTAVGRLSFNPPDKETSSNGVTIFLYGYGGHANITTQGILKGPVGSAFLTMGELQQLSGPLVKTFSIYNKGPLTGFAVILVDSIGLDLPRLRDCVEITPLKTLVPPEGTITFRVEFKPRREDIRKIIKKISHVLTIANLRIVTGDEPTRQRIRNLIRHMNESEKSKLSSTSLDKIWNVFPNELDIDELDTLKEQSEVAIELISALKSHEIALTLNHPVMDETAESTLIFPDADETIMFRTIIANPTPPPSKAQSSKVNSDYKELLNAESWSVRPNVLEIDPLSKGSSSILTVRSFFPNTQYFEVSCNFKHLFHFSPNVGQIPPGGSVEICVSYYQASFLPSEQINIMIYVENTKITVPVQIAKQNSLP